MAQFLLSCESTVDVPFAYMHSRGIPVIFYSYIIDEQPYPDDMPRFYAFLDAGKLPSTSQINQFAYYDYFKELLEQGGDVLHIAFGSGMTQSVNQAYEAAEQLRAEFPGQRLEVIDSLCSSSGYGLLVDGAADLRDADKSMDETIDWVMAWRKRVHHQFYSTDLQYFRRGGRVSGPAATVGSILGICPIMRLDDRGRIIAYDKARGKKAAVRTTVDMMAAHAVGGTDYSGKCWICHSNCLEQAEITRDAVRARFPHVQEIRIFDIGTIIASHAGPGTVAVFFFGDERAPE